MSNPLYLEGLLVYLVFYLIMSYCFKSKGEDESDVEDLTYCLSLENILINDYIGELIEFVG